MRALCGKYRKVQIEIRNIQNHQPLFRGKHNGIQIEFDSKAVRGAAILIPTKSVKAGDKLNVEADYESCDTFVSVAPGPTAFVQYNESANHYVVNAPVTLIHDDGAFFIQANDFHLMMEPQESFRVAKGDWLNFHLHGLSLWEYSL